MSLTSVQLGNYRINRSLESELGQNWFQGIDVRSQNPVPCWIYWLSIAHLQSDKLRAWPPSLEYSIGQMAIRHPSLDRWLATEPIEEGVVAVCQTLRGNSFEAVLAQRRLSWSESAAMIEQISTGLELMHAAGIVHGSICSESIWCVEEGEYVLRRDPLFPPSNPHYLPSLTPLVRSEVARLGGAAPEMTLPSCVPSFQSDLYALGCLWYRAMTGSAPAVGSPNSLQGWAELHTTGDRKRFESYCQGSPLGRCLAHLLARNPTNRFASVTDFRHSLEQAVVADSGTAAMSATITQLGSPMGSPSRQVSKKTSKKKNGKKRPVWLLPALAIGSCLIFGLLLTVLIQNDSGSDSSATMAKQPLPNGSGVSETASAANAASTIAVSAEANSARPSDSVGEYFSVVPDNGQLLWVPPQAGSAYSLEMLPAGAEGILFLSSKVWHPSGSWNGVGKWWLESHPNLMKHLTETPLLGSDQIQSVTIALYPSKEPGVPRPVYRIGYTQPRPIEEIVQETSGFSIQLFDPKASPKKGIWSNDSATNPMAIAMDGLQTDGAMLIKRVTVGPADLIIGLQELEGGSAPMRRQMEALLKVTDSRSDLTVLLAPSFLRGDGRELLTTTPKLEEFILDAIDESVQAFLLTTTLDSKWFTEVRWLTSETRDSGKMMTSLKAKVQGLPDRLERSLAEGETVHPYWRALGLRLPQMMRSLNRYGRFGLEDGQIVANVYLPSDALSNLAISSWMALNSMSSDATLTTVATTKPPIKSIDEILASKIKIEFVQESLEAALQLVAAEVSDPAILNAPMTMSINGTAFKEQGITQNQSIKGFIETDVPVRTVLTDLVLRANPVVTVKSPTERDQKVVWVVLDDAARPGQKKIELTTRVWAEANGVAMPKEFVAE